MKFTARDDASGEVESRGPLLPLRMLVVADLVPRDAHNAGASAPEGAIRIDPARFDDIFAKLRPRVAVDVPSVLAEGRPTRVDLAPTSLKSFRPDGLCAELPLLRSLLDGRLVLDRLRDGSITQDQARSELDRLWKGSPFAREVLGLVAGPSTSASSAPAASAISAAPAASDSSIDSILSMVDLPSSGSSGSAPVESRPAAAPVPAEVSKFGDLIAQVARTGRSGAGRPVSAMEAIGRVERALGAQIGAILQHPEVRRLEQTWRGLKLLLDAAQGHSGIRIDLVSARLEQAAEALDRAARANASVEPPVVCAVVDITVDGTAAAFSRLAALADVAEKHAMPVIVNGAPKLLGADDLRGIERLDNKAALFEASHQVPWRSAVARPNMRWVSIAMNGALARMPYDKGTSRVREAVIKEVPDDESAHVFTPPAYVVGALVVQSFRETSWPCRIIGASRGGGGVVGNLPVREIKGGYESEEGVAIPTEAFISTDTQRELAKSGVLMLAAAPNSDAVYVMNAPTAYVPPPKRTYDSATTEPEERYDRVSLVDQLFVARLVQFLHAFCSKLPSNSDPAEVQPVVEGALWTLFENAPPGGLEIIVKANSSSHGTSAAVTVRPRRFLGVSMEEISLEMPLG